jgi:hypothetical protein
MRDAGVTCPGCEYCTTTRRSTKGRNKYRGLTSGEQDARGETNGSELHRAPTLSQHAAGVATEALCCCCRRIGRRKTLTLKNHSDLIVSLI